MANDIQFVALTHNLLVWVKQTRLGQSPLATATAHALVSYAARVRAHVHWDGQWHIRILRPHAGASHWALLLIEALTRPLVSSNYPCLLLACTKRR